MRNLSAFAFVALVLGMVVGCSSMPSKGGFGDVEKIVQERLDARVYWYQGELEDQEATSEVARLLSGELTLDAAIQIALLNNRTLQAEYEELGVAQADLVQAGLLRNPVFFASARDADVSGLTTNTEIEVVQDFLDILMRPARKRMASTAFEAAKLRVAGQVLGLAAEVKDAYYGLQGSGQVAEMLGVIARASGAAYEFSRRQHIAGNLNDLDLASQQGLFEHARIDLTRAEAMVVDDRERLNRLLGLWGADTGWTIPAKLPPIPESDPDLNEIESLALTQRLDLATARLESQQLAEALNLTLRWRWVAVADFGFSRERDSDGLEVKGPNLMIEIPIFDQGQARLARLEALNRQSEQRMMALAIEIRSRVREIRNRLLVQRALAQRYERVLIPLRQKIVSEALKHYNFMLVGVYRLLEARQDEVDAYREYIEATRDYWQARTTLELAVGGRLPANHEQTETPPSIEHHHEQTED